MSTVSPVRSLFVAGALGAALAAGPWGTALAMPIPQGDGTDAPAFQGAPATQQPVSAVAPPRHPFMAPNERSNLHVDAYQTDANRVPGPLGQKTSSTSTYLNADCASVTFDSKARVETICVGLQGPLITGGLYLFDPRTLDTIAHFDLPPRQPGVGNPFTDFSGGGYFYLDNRDRAVIPTSNRHIYVVGQKDDKFVLEHDYDVSSAMLPTDKILSALPDWNGLLWFVSAQGVVGTLDFATGAVKKIDTAEANGNSFAVDDSGGVYIVTDAALYRFDAVAGAPVVTWREVYDNTGEMKPGQTEKGSGTTPTVMENGLVSITDNADPMNVVVYKRDKVVAGSRLVCKQPVFSKGSSATDNSLIAAGRSIVVENNYGYSGPAATEQGRTTAPGIERVDLDADGSGCSKVWHSDEISPTVVPKLSLANGIVYAYTHPGGDSSDPWFLTALDFRTGRTVYKQLAGSGLGFNNNYAPVTLGPDGAAYVGVLGGLVVLRDSSPPPGAARTPSSSRARPRLVLRLKARRVGPRRCANRRLVRAGVAGRDRHAVRRVEFRLGRRARVRDAHYPFTKRVRIRRMRRAQTLGARVRMRDGRLVKLRGKVRLCLG
jgi:hypothetical protein